MSVLSLDAEPGGLAAQVTLTVFSTDGRSISTPLGHPGIGLFRSGACDQFTVCAVNDLFILFKHRRQRAEANCMPVKSVQ